jgi:hypothetical protein
MMMMMMNIAEFLNTKYAELHVINIIKSHESDQPNINSTVKTAAKVAEELSKSDENSDTRKEGIQHTEARLVGSLKKTRDSKELHGQYIGSMDRQLICGEDTFIWLSRGDMKGETGSEIRK